MAGDPRLTNPATEIREILLSSIRRRNAEAQVSRMSPTNMALYANYTRDYPWMQPGVIRAASMAGISPDNPDMVRIARASLGEGIASGRLATGPVHVASLNPGSPNRSVVNTPTLRNRRPGTVTEDPFQEYISKGLLDEDGVLHRPDRPRYDSKTDTFSYKSEEGRALDRDFTDLLRLIHDEQGGNKPIPYKFEGQWYQWHPGTGNSEQLTREEGERVGNSGRIDLGGAFATQFAAEVPALDSITRGVQSVTEPAYQALQPVVRTAGMGANYAIQEFQQVGRNINLAVRDVQQHGFGVLLEPGKLPSSDEMKFGGESTDIGIAIENLVRGEGVDTGSGWFVSPTSEVAKERVRREAEAGQIGGHNITWGRWAASAITNPNTRPFDVMSGLIDFGVAVADPTAAGLGASSKARAAARLFEAEDVAHVGGTMPTWRNWPNLSLMGSRGRHPTVDYNQAQKLFDSPTGVKMVDNLTATTSPYQVGLKLNNQGLEFKHDPALYALIADTRTAQETRSVLNDAISNGNIREVADLTQNWGHGIAASIQRKMPRSRLMDKMPGLGVHLSDPVDVVNQVMRSYRNVNAPEEAIEQAVNVLSRQRTRSGRRNAILEVFGHGENSILARHNIDPEIADELTRVFRNNFNEMWRGLVDELGTEVPTWEHMLANGEKTYVGGPHALIELIEDWMPFPDARALRDLTSKFPNLISKIPEDSKTRILAELPGAVADYYMQEIWKPLALARGAWLVRVLGEGQMRIAADGLDSLFSGHPLEAVGFMFSKPHFGIKARVPTTFLDDPWEEIQTYESSLSRINNWTYRPGMQETTTKTTLYQKGRHHDKEYRRSWGRQLLKFNYDPVYSHWMGTHSVDETYDWLVNGKGRRYLREFQEAFADGSNMQTEEQVRKYITDIEVRWNTMTNGDTELFDVIKSGFWTDEKGEAQSIYRAGKRSVGNPEISSKFTKWLAGKMESGPKVVAGREMHGLRGKTDYPTLRRHAVQNFLYGAMSRSENLLARSPVYRQAYAREMADMIQWIGASAKKTAAEERAAFIAKARKLNVPNRTIKHMEHLARTKAPGRITMAEADLLANGRAMRRTQKLLYSYSERRQVFDIARNFVPFGDAWWEVLSTWGRIVNNSNGKPLRRAQQIIEGSINSGFFHENREGDLAFTYPFMGSITQAISGVPIEMEGRVKGLSMFGEVIPGLGPFAQVPAAWLTKGEPKLQDMEQFLVPFGAPEGAEILNWKTWAPGWLKTGLSLAGFRTAHDKRMWESTIASVADYKMSTGDYGMSESEQNRLWQDSEAAAQKIMAIRTVAQFWAPAAPRINWLIEDKQGRNISVDVLAEEFHNADDKDFETAVAEFIDKYGEDAIGALTASSSTPVPGMPDTLEGQAWIDDHPEIEAKYPLVYALFAPNDGEFDIATYTRQFASGDRMALSARQHIQMNADWLNRYWRQEAMAMMQTDEGLPVRSYADMNQEQRAAWDEITAVIDDQYPSAVVGVFERPKIDDMIDQLEEAVKDKDIRATPAGPALVEYLQLRADAQAGVEELVDAGVIDSQIKGFTKARVLAPIREALRSEAQRIIDDNPAFEPFWNHVFSRELIKD